MFGFKTAQGFHGFCGHGPGTRGMGWLRRSVCATVAAHPTAIHHARKSHGLTLAAPIPPQLASGGLLGPVLARRSHLLGIHFEVCWMTTSFATTSNWFKQICDAGCCELPNLGQTHSVSGRNLRTSSTTGRRGPALEAAGNRLICRFHLPVSLASVSVGDAEEKTALQTVQQTAVHTPGFAHQ